MRSTLDYAWTHRAVIVLTFELFWIAVALLGAAGGQPGSDVAPFVYVNF